jgi:hypothetical protein
MRRPPVVVVNNEFFIVPGANSFASGKHFDAESLPNGNSSAHRKFLFHSALFHAAVGDSPYWLGDQPVFGLSLAFKF